jgi:hypothetical protein
MLIQKSRGAAFLAADRVGRLAAILGVPFRIRGRGATVAQSDSTETLVDAHFKLIGQSDHMCRPTLTRALLQLRRQPATIIETGSSAWGTNSSILFDAYVRRFGGSFETVDIRSRPMLELRDKLSSKSQAYCSDSVSFLDNWALKNKDAIVNLAYLDSWDLSAHDPWPAPACQGELRPKVLSKSSAVCRARFGLFSDVKFICFAGKPRWWHGFLSAT